MASNQTFSDWYFAFCKERNRTPGQEEIWNAAFATGEESTTPSDDALRAAVFVVLEGFTLPHDVRKALETAYYAAPRPTPSPAASSTDAEAARKVMGEWIAITDLLPQPEVLVLCWDGAKTFVEWFGSLPDAGRGVTHWMPYPTPPGAASAMHDGRRAFTATPAPAAAADTASEPKLEGMTVAGDGASMLGKLMREQRASRLGVYPDGNPNAALATSQSASPAVQPQEVGEATPGDSIKKYRLTWQEAEAICVRDEVDEALREFVHDSTGDNAVGLARCIVESWLRHPSLTTPAPSPQAVKTEAAPAVDAGEVVAWAIPKSHQFSWDHQDERYWTPLVPAPFWQPTPPASGEPA